MCDPCEKDTVDALGEVTMQEREDLTASAQVSQCCFYCCSSKYFCAADQSLNKIETSLTGSWIPINMVFCPQNRVKSDTI